MSRSPEPPSDPKSLIAAGYQARRENRLSEAKTAFTQAVHHYRDTDPENPQLAEALRGLGQIERDLGDIPAALQHHREAADLYRTLQQPLAVAHTIRHIADIQRENGDLTPAAAAHYDEALLIYRDHPETKPLDMANTLRGYALFKAATAHPEAAIASWHEARTFYEQAATQTGLDMQPAFDEIDSQLARLSARESSQE